MTHQDAGHYAAKHPEATLDPQLEKSILSRAENGRISCAAAHLIAAEQECSPKTVGMNIDLLEMRLHRCQLGLFGHGKGKSKTVASASNVKNELEEAIGKVTVDRHISCENAWRVAKKLAITKMEVAAACERLGIKIKPCQLGAF